MHCWHCAPERIRRGSTRTRRTRNDKESDRIDLCGRAGVQCRGDGRRGSRRATEGRRREALVTAQRWSCLGFGISALGWQRLRLDPGKVGTASKTTRPLGRAPLGSQKRRMGPCGRPLALGRNSTAQIMFSPFIATAARIHQSRETQGSLRHIGAKSEPGSLRCWSHRKRSSSAHPAAEILPLSSRIQAGLEPPPVRSRPAAYA
jgi:hypothetical protein